MALAVLPRMIVPDTNGVPRVGASLYFYQAGTTTPITVYTTSAYAVAHPSPVPSVSSGFFPAVYVNPTVNATFKLVVKDSAGSTIWTEDNIPALGFVSSDVFQLIYPKNTAEESANVTIADYSKQYQYADRYTVNATPGATSMSAAIQAAADSASIASATVRITSDNAVTAPILIKTSTTQGVSFVGENRVESLLHPTAADISQSPQNTNALIFVQNNNAHLRLENLRFYSASGYTGVAIYCKEGGGGDGSGQCLYSGLFRNLFYDIGSTNGGFLTGTLQNCTVDQCTFENTKGVFRFEGIANADNHFTNISLYNCFDHLALQTADTNGSVMLHWKNINAYVHNRGVLFDVKNWDKCTIDGVTLEPKTGAVSADAIGVGKFTDCQRLTLSKLLSVSRTDVPAGETMLEFAGSGTSSAKVTHSYLSGTRAVKVSATGSVTLEFDNCDFSTAASSCFDVSANCSGTIVTRNCKFNNAQLRCFVHSVSNSANWYSYGDEFINAGLGGNAASRNLDLSTSGEVVLYNPRIGQNNGSAAAAYYIAAGSSGTVTIIDPIFVGTPPTGLVDPASTATIKILYRRGQGADIASAASLAIPNDGDFFNVTGTTNITSITATNQKGRRITLRFAGALTFTDGSNLALAGNFVTTADDTISLVCDGTNWYETGRSAN